MTLLPSTRMGYDSGHLPVVSPSLVRIPLAAKVVSGGCSLPCMCAQCESLFEFMDRLTGKTYGLAPAPGHAPPEVRMVEEPSSSMTELNGAEFARLQHMARKRQSSFPWEENAA